MEPMIEPPEGDRQEDNGPREEPMSPMGIQQPMSEDEIDRPRRADSPWSPACMHMATTDEDREGRPGDRPQREGSPERDLLSMSHLESVPDFPLDTTKIHAWVDGSEVRGHAGYGVYFPHGEYPNVSEPVVGPQTNNRAEVSVLRAAISAVRSDEELCLYSDSKWCVDLFESLRLYHRRGWMAQGKKPVRHHDIWEDILQLQGARSAPLSVTHVYGHNKISYNEAADGLAKAGAARSKVHRTARPRQAADDGTGRARRKQMRGRGVKRQASVQTSDDNTGSDGDHGWAVPSLLDATEGPWGGGGGGGGGGHWRGGFREGRWGGGGGGAVGRVRGGGGGSKWGDLGWWGGGHRLPLPPLGLPLG